MKLTIVIVLIALSAASAHADIACQTNDPGLAQIKITLPNSVLDDPSVYHAQNSYYPDKDTAVREIAERPNREVRITMNILGQNDNQLAICQSTTASVVCKTRWFGGTLQIDRDIDFKFSAFDSKSEEPPFGTGYIVINFTLKELKCSRI